MGPFPTSSLVLPSVVSPTHPSLEGKEEQGAKKSMTISSLDSLLLLFGFNTCSFFISEIISSAQNSFFSRCVTTCDVMHGTQRVPLSVRRVRGGGEHRQPHPGNRSLHDVERERQKTRTRDAKHLPALLSQVSPLAAPPGTPPPYNE